MRGASVEASIVWKYDPSTFAYLREGTYWSTKRRGAIHGWSGGNGWVRDIEQLRARATELKASPGRKDEYYLLVGYAEAASRERGEADQGLPYIRRYWWLKSHDRDAWPDGVYKRSRPAEVVDPLGISLLLAPAPI